jgi:hypothetical protein
MEILLEVLKDKTRLIKFLLDTIQKSDIEKNGLLKLSESLTRDEPNLKIENIAKCVATTMSITAKQQHSIQQLAIIALIQCQSNDFDVDVAKMLNKLGKGQEALQQMFKNKLNGNG